MLEGGAPPLAKEPEAMVHALHHRISERRRPLFIAAASALWTASAMIAAVLAAAILLLWVFVTRAS
jgi:hypothetical protein